MRSKLKISALLLFAAVLVGLALKGNVSASKAPVSPQLGEREAQSSSIFPAISSGSADTIAINPFDGVGVVYAVQGSSGAFSSFLVLRDSATANVNSTTHTLVNFQSNSTSWRVQFDPPLRFYNGLSVNASACVNMNSPGYCYSVLYDVP